MIHDPKPSGTEVQEQEHHHQQHEQQQRVTPVAKPLSFSISRILSDADDKKSSATNSDVSNEDDVTSRVPKLHGSTVHHFAPPVDTEQYNHFESQVKSRACSTPEADYPSPTPPSPQPRYTQTSGSLKYHSSYLPQRHYYSHVPYIRPNIEPLRINEALDDRNLNRTVTPEPVCDSTPGSGNNFTPEQHSDKSLDSIGDSYNQSPSPFKAKKKKTRTVFSRSQVYQLEAAFDMKRYLSSAERAGLAASLNLSETQIKIWFQNRRNKWKRQINGEMDEIPIPPAFAASYLQSAYAAPSLNSYSHVTRDDLMRSNLKVPAYYSHPYGHEKLHQPFL